MKVTPGCLHLFFGIDRSTMANHDHGVSKMSILDWGENTNRAVATYVTVYSSEHTELAVKNLTVILLADFDARFKPVDPSGKITYTGSPDVGARNRYTVVHPYLVDASFLDPQVKGHLGGTDNNVDYVMLPDHFEALRLDVVNHMIAYCLVYSIYGDNCNSDPAHLGDI